jgi:hypothetical protein
MLSCGCVGAALVPQKHLNDKIENVFGHLSHSADNKIILLLWVLQKCAVEFGWKHFSKTAPIFFKNNN